MHTNRRLWLYALFGLFALSGFSGLIYESIWSHYLKLLLGHAAYAQTLVLAIFMGGMAGGAWMAGRLLPRIANPLRAYCKVELLIGLFGLSFHLIFKGVSAFVLDTVLPAVGANFLAEILRWFFAAMLVLPQSVLLGATFPLMSAGLLRAFPALPGKSISLLYFTNSMGAVFGVLASGFLLIGAIGLPGTVLVAALSNFLLAVLVYAIASRVMLVAVQVREEEGPQNDAAENRGLQRALLMVAMLTGLSSFIYEVGWIRMLTLVLGASTHAFELMLSAFILGLALGGLWIRRHIDASSSERVLAVVQLLMGVCALLTVVFYNRLFDLMQLIMMALNRNDAGYLFFNLSSHVVAMFMMLPTTFLAGMTLPLVTYVLFSRGEGESAIGKVYAFNTLGAILGVWLTVWVLMPLFGLKSTIVAGAMIDMALGVYLLRRAKVAPRLSYLLMAVSIVLVSWVAYDVKFDPARMVSGVFRHGQGVMKDVDVLFHRDGRTATVDVYTSGETLSISTNGKPDASVMRQFGGPRISADEPTMVMMGGLPLLYKPDAKTAAVIGMGSGISAHVLLSSPYLQRVDTVEIEPAMVEGARYFDKYSFRTFNDRRSHINIDDAKSYFALNRSRYDLIVSEPSNPWVSGVSSLFTNEFYARIGSHLSEHGMLVQWLHAYESDPQMVASILRAIEKNFSDFAVYGSNDTDMVVVAVKEGRLPAINDRLFSESAFQSDMRRMGWYSKSDVEAHFMVDKSMLFAWLSSVGAPANSDFHPFLDQRAAAARFKSQSFTFFLDVADKEIPLPGLQFYNPPIVAKNQRPIAFRPATSIVYAQRLAETVAHGPDRSLPLLPEHVQVLDTLLSRRDCKDEAASEDWRLAMSMLMSLVLPRVDAATAGPVLDRLAKTVCAGREAERQWMTLYRAVAERNLTKQGSIASAMLDGGLAMSAKEYNYALAVAMLSRIVAGEYGEAMELFSRSQSPTAVMVLLNSHARMGREVVAAMRRSRGLQ